MADRRFVKIKIGRGEAKIVDLGVPSILPPQKAGAKPVVVNRLTVKNVGTAKDHIVATVQEANPDGSRIKELWSGVVDLDPGRTHTWTNIRAEKGLSKDYPGGSTLYLCIITFAFREPSWPKDCRGLAAAEAEEMSEARFVGIPIMEKPERNYIKAAAGAFGAAMTVLPLMLRRW